jgi:membrane protein YqaA with SNARE-associated domain
MAVQWGLPLPPQVLRQGENFLSQWPNQGHGYTSAMEADVLLYAGLFVTAFVAATILPAQSEAALVGLLLAGHPAWLLLTVATVGNVLGSVVNWGLGRAFETFRHRRWFPVSGQTMEKASGWYQRFGRWSLLLSWAPFIGDPLTIAAGVLRERLTVFVALVTLAKAGRYAVLIWIAGSWNAGQVGSFGPA